MWPRRHAGQISNEMPVTAWYLPVCRFSTAEPQGDPIGEADDGWRSPHDGYSGRGNRTHLGRAAEGRPVLNGCSALGLEASVYAVPAPDQTAERRGNRQFH
jgi:hypothetical protein